MSRSPIPTEVLKLRGTARKHRIAKRAGELQLTPNFPEPPNDLPAEALAEWARIKSESQYATVLTGADRQVMILYTTLSAEYNAGACGKAEPMQTSRVAQLRALCGDLGMTPPSRSRIQPPGEKKRENKFASLSRDFPIDEPERKRRGF